MAHTWTRRALLRNLGVLGAVAALPLGCARPDDEDDAPSIFAEGVASGDPLPDAVILWTRVTTSASSVDVTWEISGRPDFGALAASGTFTTNADRDHTVKVDARGLSAGTTYYYRFKALGETSPIGRTRTTPSGSVSRVRLGVVSCSSLAHGYFHAYRHLATRLDLDAIVHLGDYVYEYASRDYGEVRAYEPDREIVTLDDYRTRYRQYRRDADLQAVHRQFPFITVWDDHESTNNAWSGGAGNHQPDEGDWALRKRVAAQVYSEYMPIRDAADGRIYRGFTFGDLVDLNMLDTRLYGRDEQAERASDPKVADPSRQLLGAEQERWLAERIATSKAKWQVVGQQVVVSPFTVFFNGDAWDGYPGARDRLFGMFEASPTKNVVVLTGDIHMSFAFEMVQDPKAASYEPGTGKGSYGAEFVVPGVTSPGFPDQLANVAKGLVADNRHLRWADVNQRGYVVLDVTPERVQSAWYHYTEVDQREATPRFSAAWSIKAGSKSLYVDTEAAAPPDPPAAA
jgi:alkaline phosphatase D